MPLLLAGVFTVTYEDPDLSPVFPPGLERGLGFVHCYPCLGPVEAGFSQLFHDDGLAAPSG
jgi:hypothetical protein